MFKQTLLEDWSGDELLLNELMFLRFEPSVVGEIDCVQSSGYSNKNEPEIEKEENFLVEHVQRQHTLN